MKPRRPEVTVFSIATLDLFASGMGAFILLTVMSMPFFPNTGSSSADVEQLKSQLADAERRTRELQDALAEANETASTASTSPDVEQLRSQLADAERRARNLEEALAKATEAAAEASTPSEVEQLRSQLAEAERRAHDLQTALAEATEAAAKASVPPDVEQLRSQLADAERRARDLEDALAKASEAAAKASIQELELVICLDVTGSMTEQIDGLKREIGILARILDGLAPSAGVGVVAFGDRRWARPLRRQPIVETSKLQPLLSFVEKLEPNMRDPRFQRNLDGPEAVAAALEAATTMNWSGSGTRKYIVVITDNAAYPDREQTAIQTASRFAAVEGRHVSTVRANFTQDRLDRQAADRFLRQLAAAGKGQFVDAAGGESMVGSLLLAILET